MKGRLGLGVSVVFVVALSIAIVLLLSIPLQNPLLIDGFENKDAHTKVQYGSKSFQLTVTSSREDVCKGGWALKAVLKMMPQSYNFIASGKGLPAEDPDPNYEWANKHPEDIDWTNVIGISYYIKLKDVKVIKDDVEVGPDEVEVNRIRVATDLVDDTNEILRNKKTVIHKGKWIKVHVYFLDVTTRDDYQRDWRIIENEKFKAGRVDNHIKSYQIEIVELVSEKPIDLGRYDVELTYFIDHVELIEKKN